MVRRLFSDGDGGKLKYNTATTATSVISVSYNNHYVPPPAILLSSQSHASQASMRA